MNLLCYLTFALFAVHLPPDLSKVDRHILKEPTYQTKTPHYCLMVFGIGAASKVWMVQDGDMLYVDTNGNGDLTETGKQFKKTIQGFVIPALTVDGLTHTNLQVNYSFASIETPYIGEDWERIRQSDPVPRVWSVSIKTERSSSDKRDLPRHIKYLVNGDSRGLLMFGNSTKDAPILHFDGAYSLSIQDATQTLAPGQKSKVLIGVGCHGVGPGTFSFIMYRDTIPNDVYPVVEITYPVKPGENALRRKYELKQRC